MAYWSITPEGGTVELKSVAALVGDLIHPAEIAARSKVLATPKHASALRLSPFSPISMGQPIAANDADDFWQTLRARIDECDRLINTLCNLRRDDDAHRADLLAVRKSMAPQQLDSDIVYLKAAIAASAPPPPAM